MKQRQTMTIQEMFDLTSTFLDRLSKFEGESLQGVAHDINTTISLQDSITRLYCYLPMFTPMDCKHCKHTNCNRKRGRGVCSEYEVELNKEL